MIDFLLKKEPMQPSRPELPIQEFPKDKYGRSFQTSWYWKILPGNVQVKRDWISYSLIIDKALCHHCLCCLVEKDRKVG